MDRPPSSRRTPIRLPLFGAGLGFVIVLALLAWMLIDHPAGSEGTSSPAATERSASSPTPSPTPAAGKLKHLVFVMQENRSFDSYFGTFPGADGFPTKNGHVAVCLDNPILGRCQRPYHDPNLVNVGGPHDSWNARAAIDEGRMDGFIRTILTDHAKSCRRDGLPPECQNGRSPDVMGYHDAREIPNYWAFARHFLLQDHLFESAASWSVPAISTWCRDGRPSAPTLWIR